MPADACDAVHAQHARRAEVAAAVAREHLVAGDDLLDRPGGAVGHRDRACPATKHWSASPTTMTLRCSSARRRTSSHWARFVSWNSSTRTWRKRWRQRSSASGCSRNSFTTSRSRSSKSAADASAEPLLVLDVDLGQPLLGRRGRRRRAPAPGTISSFFIAEIAPCSRRGGNRFGSRFMSRRT